MLGTVLNRQAEEEQLQYEEAAAASSDLNHQQGSSVYTDNSIQSSAAAPNTRSFYEEGSESVEYSSSDEGDSESDEESLTSDTKWTRIKRYLRKIATKLRYTAVTLADVDNVWDSPDANDCHHHKLSNYGSINNYDNNRNVNTTKASVIYNAVTGTTAPTRNRTAVLFWFILLSLSYASERSTFKLLVDRVGPFRLFSAELIVGCHATLLALIVLIGEEWRRREKNDGGLTLEASGLPIPLADIGCEFF